MNNEFGEHDGGDESGAGDGPVDPWERDDVPDGQGSPLADLTDERVDDRLTGSQDLDRLSGSGGYDQFAPSAPVDPWSGPAASSPPPPSTDAFGANQPAPPPSPTPASPAGEPSWLPTSEAPAPDQPAPPAPPGPSWAQPGAEQSNWQSPSTPQPPSSYPVPGQPAPDWSPTTQGHYQQGEYQQGQYQPGQHQQGEAPQSWAPASPPPPTPGQWQQQPPPPYQQPHTPGSAPWPSQPSQQAPQPHPQQAYPPQPGQPQQWGQPNPGYQPNQGYQQPQGPQYFQAPQPGHHAPGWLGQPPATPAPTKKRNKGVGIIVALAALFLIAVVGLGSLFLIDNRNEDDPTVAAGDGGEPTQTTIGVDDDPDNNDPDIDDTEPGSADGDEGEGDEAESSGERAELTIAATIEDLDAYWTEEFPELFGGDYEPLASEDVFPFSDVSSLSCGPEDLPLDELEGNALYCPTDDYIAFDNTELFPRLRQEFGDLAPALVMAHEWGHAIQARSGVDDRQVPTVLVELQADCYAGGWANRVLNGESDKLQVFETDLDQGVGGLLQFADPIFVTSGQAGAHGSGFDRVNAFGDGVREGSEACLDYFDGGISPIDLELNLGADGDGNLPFDGAPATFVEDLQLFWETEASDRGVTVPEVVDITSLRDTTGLECDIPAGAAVQACLTDDGTRAALAWNRELERLHNEIGDFGSALLISLEVSRVMAPSFALEASAEDLDCMSGAWTASVAIPEPDQLVLSAGDLDEAIVGMLESPKTERTVFERVEIFADGYFEGFSACEN